MCTVNVNATVASIVTSAVRCRAENFFADCMIDVCENFLVLFFVRCRMYLTFAYDVRDEIKPKNK